MVKWEQETGVDITMPAWGSFSIFVFLKKYRLYCHEEEEIFLILSGMAPEIPRWKRVISKTKRRGRVGPGG